MAAATAEGGGGLPGNRRRQRRSGDTVVASRRHTDGGRARRLRGTMVGDGGEWPECVVAPADSDRGATSGCSSGFVRAPITVWLVSMASSPQEEHNVGLACS